MPVTIRGVGVDVVDIDAFAAQLDQPGTAFEANFTPGELADARDRKTSPARHLAVRWAAKEAVIKAWSADLFGTPPVLGELVHREIEVVTDAWGRPRIRLHGAVAQHLDGDDLQLSLSHDGNVAIAYVILQSR